MKRPATMIGLILAVILSAGPASGGEAPSGEAPNGEAPNGEAREDPWQPWAFFLGRWRGEEDGAFGQGRGERSYRTILQGRYLLVENRSTFPPQEGLPEGDEHEDWVLLSYDRARSTYVLRQFNSEGYVNRFVLDPSSRVPEQMIFVGEASENAPPGFQTRLTYQVVGPDEFTELFEMAPAGSELGVMLRNRWRRAAGPGEP